MHIECQNSTQKSLVYCITALLVIFAYLAILRSPLLYVDDALRVHTYLTINQGVHGRPFADILYMFLTNGLFIDFSPFTQILALLLMVASGLQLYDTFAEKSFHDYSSAAILQRSLTAIAFSIFPLHFATISYRFDSLSFGMAIFCVTVAFVLATKNNHGKEKIISYILAGILITLSLGFYQVMFGIYACCAVFYIAHMALQDIDWKLIARKTFDFLAVCVIGILFYTPILIYTKYQAQLDFYGIGPHPHVNSHIKIASLTELPRIVYTNILKIYTTVGNFSGLDAFTIISVALICVFISSIIVKKIGICSKIIALLALPCALVTCFGLQLFMTKPLLEARTAVPLSAFVTCLFILVLLNLKSSLFKKGILGLLIIFILSSASFLAAVGNAQRDQYTYEQEFIFNGLEADLMNLYANGNLKAFYVTPLEPPVCTTLQVLKAKYGFLKNSGAMSYTFFSQQKILSYLPIKYIIKAHFLPQEDVLKLAPVINKPNYSIQQFAPGKYVVTLHTIPTKPFTADRWAD